MKVGPKTNLYQTHCISSQFNWHFRFSCCCLLPFFPLIAIEIILMLFVSRQMSVSNWRWISFCSFFAINRRISSLLITILSLEIKCRVTNKRTVQVKMSTSKSVLFNIIISLEYIKFRVVCILSRQIIYMILIIQWNVIVLLTHMVV